MVAQCDWCGARGEGFAETRAHIRKTKADGVIGAAGRMHACPSCKPRMRRFSTLVNRGAAAHLAEYAQDACAELGFPLNRSEVGELTGSLLIAGSARFGGDDLGPARAYLKEAAKQNPRRRRRKPEPKPEPAGPNVVALDVFRMYRRELVALDTPEARAELARRKAKREAKRRAA